MLARKRLEKEKSIGIDYVLDWQEIDKRTGKYQKSRDTAKLIVVAKLIRYIPY